MTESQKAFEEWYGYYGFNADWSQEHGCYQDKQAQFMFAAWLASRESLKQELMSEEIVEAATNAVRHVELESRLNAHEYIDGGKAIAKAALQAVVGAI